MQESAIFERQQGNSRRQNSLTDLSIIIPSYNSCSRLHASLLVLAQRDEFRSHEYEVIVVDDGSTDDTQNVINRYRSAFPRFQSVFQARDSSSCRARARNLGLREAAGRTLLFLDAGVLPSAALLRRALESPNGSPEGVMYKTLGLFGDAETAGAIPVDSKLFPQLSQLAKSRAWDDVRQPYLENGSTPGLALPAPWLLAWTCALSVPRNQAIEVGGFDEGFAGWGAEDAEFAGRLALRGLPFVWGGNEAVAIHVPHHPTDDHREGHSRNAQRLHAKLCTRESELFALWQDGFSANLFGARLDRLCLDRVTPPVTYSADDVMVGVRRRLLCSGLRSSVALASLNPVVALAHEPHLQRKLAATWPSARVHQLVGVRIPYADHEFEQALVGDFIRLLPSALREPYLRELSRVAPRVSMVLSTLNPYQHRYRIAAGWGWCSLDSLIAIARQADLQVLDQRVLNPETVLLRLERKA